MAIQDIRIFIADSQLLVREGLKALLAKKSHLFVVGEASHTAELREILPQTPAEVVILDYSPPGHFSTEDVQLIKELSPSSEVLVITSDLERAKVMNALNYGAKGFLTKECGEVEIMGAIRATANAEKFFCNTVLDILLERQLSNVTPEDCNPVNFTNREAEIISLMAKGCNAQKIADRLSLSVHTIYTHRKNIRKKMGASTAAEVILYAIRTGLVASPVG